MNLLIQIVHKLRIKKKILIKIKFQIMIIRNIDVTLGLICGTISTVKQVIHDGFCRIPIKIKITIKELRKRV